MARSASLLQNMRPVISVFCCLLVASATAFQSSFSPLWVQPIRARPIARTEFARVAVSRHFGQVLPGKSRGNWPRSGHLQMSVEACLPPENILTAVEELGGRVTIADVARKSGTSMTEAKRHLTEMAKKVGDLEVSSQGDLVYTFRKAFRSDLCATSRKLRLQQGVRTLVPRLQHLVRVCFGVSLFASVMLIWTSIFLLLKSRDDNYSGSSGGGLISVGWIFPADPLFWISYDAHDSRRLQTKQHHSFVEAVFSFVFGDGDPNWDLLVRKQHGILLPEQLAPFLDLPRGEIVYVFEELQTSASVDQSTQRSWPQLLAGALRHRVPFHKMHSKTDLALFLAEKEAGEERSEGVRPEMFLQEKEREFSRIGLVQTVAVWALAYANWAGGLMLGGMLRSAEAAGHMMIGRIPLLAKTLYPFLIAFGLSMMVIPLARLVIINFTNRRIRHRNQARARIAALNALNKDDLNLKLAEAREFRQQLRVVRSGDVEYTSGKSIQDQRLDLKQFDIQYGLVDSV